MESPNKVLCPNCRKLVAYETVARMTSRNIKGEKYDYKEKTAFCCECGEEVYVSGIDDDNERTIENLYRKKNGLITIDEISAIMRKYDIDKRPLSAVMGLGELTITRYMDGQLPSKRYSDMLKSVLFDYVEMKKYVEANSHSISNVAYKKISNRIAEMERLTSFDSKIEAVALCIINTPYEITDLFLQKLLYYVNAFSICLRGIWLFDDVCEAWVNGPVYRKIYEKYKVFDQQIITDIFVPDSYLSILTKEEIQLINYVMDCLGMYNGSILRNLTHKERPWLVAREGLDDSERSRNVIPQNDIKEYFEEINRSYNLSTPEGVERYVMDNTTATIQLPV